MNPTGWDVHFSNGLHQAVDLASAAANCVYAAYSGRVVKVEIQPLGDTANVSIDHHPRGLGFVTNYNHITEVQVAEGDFVREGEPIAQVSAVPETPTLHLELWAVIDRNGRDGDDSFGDSDMLPIDRPGRATRGSAGSSPTSRLPARRSRSPSGSRASTPFTSSS